MATSTALQKRTGKAGSTIFLKTLMAGTGILFVLFVLGHMYGNLHLFQGRTAFNEYAETLRTIGEPFLPRHGLLTIIEIVLFLALVAHVYSAATLSARASKARPVKYKVKKSFQASLSSKTMRWGGVFLLLFLVWHLLQFTLLRFNVGDGGDFKHDPYNLVVDGFQVWWLTLLYVLAMAALAMHLHHGIWSACQTLGLTGTPSARRTAKLVATVVAAIVAIGFVVPPLCVLFGVIK